MPRTFVSHFCSGASVLALLLASAGDADAHALGAECKLSGGTVEVEAYYDDDTAARDAKVQVEDGTSKIITEGRTDKNGRWSFPRPQPGRYLVVVDAGAGHRTQVRITIPEADGAGVTSTPSEAGQQPPAQDVPPATISDGPERSEFTRFPWLKVGIGLTVIAGLALAFFVSRRLGQPARPARGPSLNSNERALQ